MSTNDWHAHGHFNTAGAWVANYQELVMPTSFFYSPYEADPRRWERCRRLAAEQMIKEGWPAKASKFHEVQMKRARRIWREQ